MGKGQRLDYTPKQQRGFSKQWNLHFSTEPNWKLACISQRLWFHWQNRVLTALRLHPKTSPCRPGQELWAILIREVTAGVKWRGKIHPSQTDSLWTRKVQGKSRDWVGCYTNQDIKPAMVWPSIEAIQVISRSYPINTVRETTPSGLVSVLKQGWAGEMVLRWWQLILFSKY